MPIRQFYKCPMDLANRIPARQTMLYYIRPGGEATMAAPVSVRLDDDVRETLEAEARARHIGLSTYLRQIAIETATRLRRERIRAQSRAVGEYVAESAEAAALYAEWGARRLQ